MLHLERPLCPTHPAQHYIGYADDLAARIQKHTAGNGSRFMQVAKQRQIGFQVARVWRGDRTFERSLKRRKSANRLCPICAGAVQMGLQELSPAQIADALIPF
ncbi:MAG: endonuclease [Anaerolineae bacterium]|nr:endonuclease [Anaerolineae bacterium]